MAPEADPLLYCNRTEIEYIFSSLGVALRVDDNEDGIPGTFEDAALNEIIVEATDLANEYLLHHYDDVDLETSRWVRRRVAFVAAHLLSRRCGNAGQFSQEYERAIEDFEKIYSGVWFIPRLTPYANFEPSVSNQIVDYSYPRSKLRTDPASSTGGTTPDKQPLDFWPPYDWPY